MVAVSAACVLLGSGIADAVAAIPGPANLMALASTAPVAGPGSPMPTASRVNVSVLIGRDQVGDTGRVRVSSLASANAAFMPEVFRAFGKARPEVELSLASTPRPVAAGAAGEIDLALITGWDLPAADTRTH